MAVQKHLIFTLLSVFALAAGHSWVSCTDYRISSNDNTQTYSNGQCKGFGRAWSQCCENTAFGLDRGYNYQPGNSGKLCRDPLNTNYAASYSAASPMAKYSPGQQVCLAWAPKNHVSATCINGNIPDNGMEVYMSQANPTADATSVSQMTKIADWGKNPGANAFKGFQNCPNFCSNPDKATCTGCFSIPSTVKVGAVYSFIWTWEFNGLADQYSTCWEAEIVGSVQGQAVALPANYYNVAPTSGNTPVPSPPATINPPTSSSPKTSVPRTSSPGASAGPYETYTAPPVNPAPQQNFTIIYVFAGGNSSTSLLNSYLLWFFSFLVVAVLQ